MNNITMIYNANLSKAEIIIENLKSIGINTSDFESKIIEIKKEIESSISNFTSTGYSQENAINSVYQNGIDKIKKVLLNLEKYQKYYQTINECYYVQGSQSFTEFNAEELSVAVDNLIELLKILKDFSGITDNSISSVETFYDVIYETIKMEFYNNGSSKLYDYCRQSDIDSINISKSIVNEVNALKESKYDTKKIELLMKKLNSKNSVNLYLDEELIQLIVMLKNKDDYIRDLSESLSKLYDEVKYIHKQVVSLSNDKQRIINNKSKENYIKSKRTKAIILNTLPFVLTLGALTGVLYGVSRGIKGTEYKTETTIYSSLDGSTLTKTEYLKRLKTDNGDKVDDMVTIQKNYPFNRISGEKEGEFDFTRIVESTKITGVSFDDLSEYIDYDYKNIDGEYDYKEKSETKDSLDFEDKYEEPYYSVKEQHQDKKDSRVGELDARGKAGVAVLHITITFFTIMMLFMFENIEEKGPLYRLKKLKDILNEIDVDRDGTENTISKLKTVKDEFNRILNENSELKKRYLELIANPKYKYILDECTFDYYSVENIINSNESKASLELKKK